MHVAAIVVAAGRGLRAGGGTPKQFRALAGRPMLARTLDALGTHPAIGDIVVVVHPDDRPALRAATEGFAAARLHVAHGGDTRAASVRAGLAALPARIDTVLIHDAARPLVTAALVDRVLGALATTDGAAPALPVTDALWRGAEGRVAGTADRDGLWRAQTPQGFRRTAIEAAHAACAAMDPAPADDVAVARAHGLDVAIVEGDDDNIKVTLPADFDRAARLIRAREAAMTHADTISPVRTGTGFDVHRFTDGDAVILCGVRVPHDRALLGHSDADVGMHALTDAIYGALADGDIGQHFPPSDPQWKGAASDVFLRHAVARAAERGYAIGNVDVTLICERPKIGPHAAAMRAALAAIMDCPADAVGVKATTSEGLGFPGRGEGIAAMASATLVAR